MNDRQDSGYGRRRGSQIPPYDTIDNRYTGWTDHMQRSPAKDLKELSGKNQNAY